MLMYRALEGFLVQFGVAAHPHVQSAWREKTFPDEPKRFVQGEWTKGLLSFAGSGSNSRSCHMFITLAPSGQTINPHLGGMLHEVPFAEVVDGIEAIESMHFGYGDETLALQAAFQAQGNDFMEARFPQLDRILSCHIVEPEPAQPQRRRIHVVDEL